MLKSGNNYKSSLGLDTVLEVKLQMQVTGWKCDIVGQMAAPWSQ